jgi:hypothetical protein
MKTLMLASIISMSVLLSNQCVCAQQKEACYAGVFVTQQDFLNDRLSDKINTDEVGNKFTFDFPADMTLTLKITRRDSSLKFPPGSIYGYNECGKIYRYFSGGRELSAQKDYYKIEATAKGFILYSSEFVSGNEMFYSIDLTSPIHRVILKNLRRDFKGYPKFISAVTKQKRQPDGLNKRNQNEFEIVTLYKRSVSN